MKASSASASACSRCGWPLCGQDVRGLCPRCLGAIAFGGEAEDPALPVALPHAGQVAPPATEGIFPPRSDLRWFGGYELLEEIARGGMGVVFRARQANLERIVALKLPLAGPYAKKQEVARFRTEALLSAQLRHPNIVPIIDVGEANGQPFLTMELVSGPNLAELVRERPLAAVQAATLIRDVARAVHHAHSHGILHRDLKPSNVLLDASGTPRVTDFGLAKRIDTATAAAAQASGQLTLTGQVLGSPAFIAPELAGGQPASPSPASDVYSTGALLYHLLTGRAPFQAASVAETLREVLEREPVSPRVLLPGIPRDLETICLKCLEKEPVKRYASADALAEELGRFLEGQPILARPLGPAGRATRWIRRHPALATLALAVLLVGTAGLGGILWQWDRAERLARMENTQRVRAEETAARLELQLAEDLLEKDETAMALAHLARIIRKRPGDAVAPLRLLSVLTQRDFFLPVGSPLEHGKKVQDAAFSPDGRWIATASLDGTARLWDAHTGHPASDPLHHSAEVRSVSFSPDGQILLTSGDDSVALLWDTATGQKIGQPLQHGARIGSARFDPAGDQIVTASDDHTVQFWDARSGRPSAPPLQHAAPLRHAEFSPDGMLLITLSLDGIARVWDIRPGQSPAGPRQFGDAVLEVGCSPDSSRVLTSSLNRTVRIWDAATGRPVTEPLRHSDEVTTFDFSPDGQWVVTGCADDAARIWDAHTGTLRTTITGFNYPVIAVFSPDGLRLLIASADNTVRLWDAHTGRALGVPCQHDGLIWSARFSRDGQFAVTASSDRSARIWDLRPGSALPLLLPHADRAQTVAFSSDGEHLVTASSDHTVRLWSVRDGQPQALPLMHPAPVRPALFSPDGERVLTGCRDLSARLWNVRTGQPLTAPLPHGAIIQDAEFSPDGLWFATVAHAKALHLWTALTGEHRGELIRQRDLGFFAHFRPDSRALIAGLSNDDSARILEIPSGKILAELRGHTGLLNSARFSRDGGSVVTASEDGTARIWDANSGVQTTAPLLHKAHVYEAAFSPDGSQVVTASADATARVWDAQSGRALTAPLRHRGRVVGAAFSPGGSQIVTSSADGLARLWDAAAGLPLTDPFQHDAQPGQAVFSPDGRLVATVCQDGARLWEPPCLVFVPRSLHANGSRSAKMGKSPRRGESHVPGEDSVLLLADLAEAITGQRLGGGGSLEPVTSGRLAELRRRIDSLPDDDPIARWAAWLLADRSSRPVSPGSPVTVPRYVDRLIESGTLAAAREAALLAPAYPPALTHLARKLQENLETAGPAAVVEATFLQRRAETLAQ